MLTADVLLAAANRAMHDATMRARAACVTHAAAQASDMQHEFVLSGMPA